MKIRTLISNLTLLLLLILLSPFEAYGVPAYPYSIKQTLPDGSTITLQIKGDEYFGYKTTLSGYAVVKGMDGYYYYADYSNDDVVVSSVRASDVPTKTDIPVSPISQATVAQRRANSYLKRYKTWTNAAASSVSKTDGETTYPYSTLSTPLVILVEFSDLKYYDSSPVSSFDELFNSDTQAPEGSIRSYWIDNSMGMYTPTFHVKGVASVDNKASDYDTDTGYQLVIDACRALDGEVNFADYDGDGDGVVDNVIVLYAGHNPAEGSDENFIWPHMWRVDYVATCILDGVKLGSYAITSECRGEKGGEMTNIGTITHEFGHVLGLMDLYDTDGEENGEAVGFLYNSLMGAGNYNNSGKTPPYLNLMEREMLGWVTYTNLPSEGEITLEPIGESNFGYTIQTGNSGEYYVVESRNSASGWDQYMDYNGRANGAAGLMVYHVDKSQNFFGGMTAASHWNDNTPNAYADHECMRLVASTGTVDFVNVQSYFYPGNSSKTTLSGHTSPALVAWDGNSLSTSLSTSIVDIAWDGSASTFTIADEGSVSYYSLSGQVVSSSNVPLKGAIVKLVLNSSADSSLALGVSDLDDSGLASSPFTVISLEDLGTKASGEYYAQTSSDGTFSISNIPEGDYTLLVSYTGYTAYTTSVGIWEDLSLSTITLEENDQEQIQTRISHSSTVATGYLSGSCSGLKVMWSAQMIEELELVGKDINYIYWQSGIEGVTTSAKILVDGQEVFSTQFTSVSGYNTIPVTSDLVLGEGSSVEVEYTFASSASGLIAATDSGPAVAGYGDLVMINNSWVSLSNDYDIDVNICCGFAVDKSENKLDSPSVLISGVGQQWFSLIWDSSDLNIEDWRVVITNSSDASDSQVIETSSNTCMVSDLTAGASYIISVYAIYDELESDPLTGTIATLATTAPFSAMSLTDFGSNTYYVTYTNATQMPESVALFLNGSAIETDSFYAGYVTLSSGVNTIVLTLNYSDGSYETITRKVTVE